MSHCAECPIIVSKEAFDAGKTTLRSEYTMDSFMKATDNFFDYNAKVQKDCPLGEKGCPAIFIKEIKRRMEE